MKFGTFFGETLRIAYESVMSNRLRTMLTMAIIAIGIMSLVGIVTAVDSIRASITESFTSMGVGSFSIQNYRLERQGGGGVNRVRNENLIRYQEAAEFKARFDFPATVSLSVWLGGGVTATYRSNKTNPNVRVQGMDENGLRNANMELSAGRNLTARDVENYRRVVVIGSGIAQALFGNDSPLGELIGFLGGQYQVVGVLASRGGGMGADRNEGMMMVVPITTGRATFWWARPSTTITIVPDDPLYQDIAISEAEGTFRAIRGLKASDETDFSIERSDSLANILKENLAMVTMVVSIVGFITLLGAAVGLMNIMLVSVSERTREIGTRMALGAKPHVIREQFLMESIMISQMGGLMGIVLGILCGNLISLLTGGPFVIPWLWILIGVMLCLGVGIGSGYLPARNAARMDPVEALRYE